VRLAFSERRALEFASNRVRFTIEMQLAVRMKLMLPLLLFGWPLMEWLVPNLCMSTPVKRPLLGADTRFFIEEGSMPTVNQLIRKPRTAPVKRNKVPAAGKPTEARRLHPRLYNDP
jgi:hypothetical protein